MSVRHVLVVLADDAGHRTVPIRLPGHDAAFWRLLARPEDRDQQDPDTYAEEMTGQLLYTGQLLDTAGITVTAVTVTDLGPGVTAMRMDIAAPGGTGQVTTSLADGLALAVVTGAPVAVEGPVMDRLAEPVTGPDLLSAFRSRQQEDPEPGRRRFEPRNLAFTDGLRGWHLVGPRMRDYPGPEYSCTTADGRATLTAAVPEPAAPAFLRQEIFADDYHDRTVTLRGDLRLTGVADRAGLLLRVTTNRPAPRLPAEQDPANHFAFAAGTDDWTRYEVTAQVPPDANYIFFGVFLTGRGQIELRDLQLEQHPADQQEH
jgi:hypothetical protein